MLGMSAQAWWRLLRGPAKEPGAERAPHGGGRRLTIRWATPADAFALARLAQLDSSRPPRGVVLVAEVGQEQELWAAISLDDGHLIADPFKLSGELAFDLAQRARRLKRAERGRMGLLPRVFPAGADDYLMTC
jgi:hypothetical protein